jgi:hypothetical protein
LKKERRPWATKLKTNSTANTAVKKISKAEKAAWKGRELWDHDSEVMEGTWKMSLWK